MNMDISQISSDKDVGSLKTNLGLLEAEATELQVVDPATQQQASAMRTQIKDYQKAIKAKQDFFIGPAKEWTKSVTTFFRLFLDRLDKTDDIIEAKQISFHEKQEAEKRRLEEKIRQEQEKKAAKAAEKGLPPPPPAPTPNLQVDTFVRTEIGGTSFTKEWTFEITNAGEVPRQYCEPVDKLIRDAVKQGIRQIPGCRIFEATRTARR